MQALLIFALIVGATISTGPEQVPTSMCHDPLLGPSMIIYSDCGGVQEEPEKRKKEKPESVEQPTDPVVEQVDPQPAEQLADEGNEQPAVQEIGGSEEQPAEKPAEQGSEQRKEKRVEQPLAQPVEDLIEQPKEKSVEQIDEQPVDQPTEQAPDQPAEQTVKQPTEQPVEKSKKKKQNCNKGSGNGAEGCDPGNHPEKGNDDENGDGLTQNSNKEKTDRATEQETLEKQKCNKGSGNGGEGCDPGNHPEKGNDDEDGEGRPQNAKKDKKQ